MDLNISGWRWKPRFYARGGYHARKVRLRWRGRWQLHSDVVVLDVWVQYLIFLESLVSCSGDLDQTSRRQSHYCHFIIQNSHFLGVSFLYAVPKGAPLRTTAP